MTASFVIQPCLSSKDGNSNGRQRQRQHLGNGDYFVIIASSFLELLTEHAVTRLIEAPFKSI